MIYLIEKRYPPCDRQYLSFFCFFFHHPANTEQRVAEIQNIRKKADLSEGR